MTIMNSKHTLPWRIEHKGANENAPDRCQIVSADGGIDGHVAWGIPYATAVLIVHAVNTQPDLLAACEEGLEACEWVADNVSLSDPQAMRFTIDQLRAARDKARGES